MKVIYIREDLNLLTVMDCRTPTTIEFKSKLGFKQLDIIMRKEQSVLIRIMKIFGSEKISLQHSVLDYKIDLYFSEQRLAIEFDGKKHKDRDKHKEIERQKVVEKELDCEFIRINPD